MNKKVNNFGKSDPYDNWKDFCKNERLSKPFHVCNDNLHTFSQFHFAKLPQYITLTYEVFCLLLLLACSYIKSKFKTGS